MEGVVDGVDYLREVNLGKKWRPRARSSSSAVETSPWTPPA